MSPDNIKNSGLAGKIQVFGPRMAESLDGGLLSFLVGILHNSDFFYLHQHPETVYASAAVYKIEAQQV
jgi:hypothetical protein